MLDSLGGLHAQRVIGSHHSCFHAAEVRRSLHVLKAWNVEGIRKANKDKKGFPASSLPMKSRAHESNFKSFFTVLNKYLVVSPNSSMMEAKADPCT